MFKTLFQPPVTTENNPAKAHSGINWNSLTVRSIIIGVLALVMTIPLNMVNGVANERSHLYQSVLDEIGGNWG